MVQPVAGTVIRAAAVAIVSLALSELALRIYDYLDPLFIFYDESYNRFRGKPFGVNWDTKLNSGGFQDVEFPKKAPNAYRILGIGDSFAFGALPYRFNYLTLLEEDLKQWSPAVEVLNLGIPGIGPREYVAVLVREGLVLAPDAVLLSFYVGNDFEESQRAKRPFHSYSHVASLIHYLFRVLPKQEGGLKRRAEYSDYCDDCPRFDDPSYRQLVAGRSGIYLEGYRDFSRLLDNAVHYLAEMHGICQRRRIDLFVVIIPDEIQVDTELQRRVHEEFFSAYTWNNTRPNDALATRLEQMGIPYIDLLPDFAAADASAPLYRLRDTHWNIRGNRLAADVIGRRLPALIEELGGLSQ
jgi:hypothetical protein